MRDSNLKCEGRGRELRGRVQAIEAKEGVDINNETITLASISYQNFFRAYPKLSGMSGTASTEIDEFSNIYNMSVQVRPPHALPDEGCFRTASRCTPSRCGRQQPILSPSASAPACEKVPALLQISVAPPRQHSCGCPPELSPRYSELCSVTAPGDAPPAADCADKQAGGARGLQ